jgi:hypothetical protein
MRVKGACAHATREYPDSAGMREMTIVFAATASGIRRGGGGREGAGALSGSLSRPVDLSRD